MGTTREEAIVVVSRVTEDLGPLGRTLSHRVVRLGSLQVVSFYRGTLSA